MAGVLCVGIATQDYVFGLNEMPTRAEKYRANDLAVVGGGIAANAAVAVARLGGRAMIATRLGDDRWGAISWRASRPRASTAPWRAATLACARRCRLCSSTPPASDRHQPR